MLGVAAGKSFGAVADGFGDHRVVFPEPGDPSRSATSPITRWAFAT